MTVAQLTAWIVMASNVASAGHRPLSSAFALELATQITIKPIFSGPIGDQQDAALMTALAWMEGGNQPAIVGDHGDSYCVYQINLPNAQKTLEGWSGNDLTSDAKKCITVARRILRTSVMARENRDGVCPLCLYARGKWTPEAQRLSDHRMALAKRLLADVKVTGSEGTL